MKKVHVDVQQASQFPTLPEEAKISAWVEAALASYTRDCEITIRLVDLEEMTALNSTYRKKNKPTNVLSFPVDLPIEMETDLLGDIVICPQVVFEEAIAQLKPFEDRFAHMVIHGCLHLLGYDHQTHAEADIMENLEIELLSTFNIRNPYEARKHNE